MLWKGTYLFILNLLQVLKKNKGEKASETDDAYSKAIVLSLYALMGIWVELVLQTDERQRKDVLATDGPLSC